MILVSLRYDDAHPHPDAARDRERVVARRLAKGRYTLTVRATDAHGNTATEVLRFRL